MSDLNRYIGIPFVTHGRAWHGADCWGLVWLWYLREKSVELPMLADGDYKDTNDGEAISDIVRSEKSNWSNVEVPQTGDVVVLNITGMATHVGIYLDGMKMLHVMKGTDSCIESLKSSKWKNRIEGYYRYE